MDKAPDAFRTISEVADHLETPAHVLRFWETRFPQVKPVKGAGGRRYYRPSDVALLAGIRRLLHTDGLTIRGVQKILREQGVRHVAALGGEELPETESLDAILPQPEPMGQVVPLTPRTAPEASEPAALSPAALSPADLPPDLADVPAPDAEPEIEALADILPDGPYAGPDDEAPLAAEVLSDILPDGPYAGPEVEATADALATDIEVAAPDQPAPDAAPAPQPGPLAPPEPMPGFGGFAADLDVPRAGEGGFIAFSTPLPSPPEVPRPAARPGAAPAPRQTSLFDLPGVAPDAEAPLIEVEEAPHVFVEDDETGPAEIAPFAPDVDAAISALMREDLDTDLPGLAEEATPDPGPLAMVEIAPDAAPEAAETEPVDHASPQAIDSPDQAERPVIALPQLAGLAPRLRALGPLSDGALFPLADLQARLGLLRAQMAEAHARSSRTDG